MGCFETSCIVCGGPVTEQLVSDIIDIEEMEREEGDGSLTISRVKRDLAGTSWLSQSFGISSDDRPRPLGKYTDYGSFEMPDGEEFHGATNHRFKNVPEGSPYGVICHRQCYKLLSKELGYEIKFDDLWPLLMKQTIHDHFSDWSYGGITEYHDQSFDTHALLVNGDGWMLKDPIRNTKNAERILASWKPLCRKFGAKKAE